MKFSICPDCGAHLDFGEPCDCKETQPEAGKAEEPAKGGECYGTHPTATGRKLPRSGDKAVGMG